jgi:hypothetical protein
MLLPSQAKYPVHPRFHSSGLLLENCPDQFPFGGAASGVTPLARDVLR